MANQSFAAALAHTSDTLPGKSDYELFPRALVDTYRDDDARVLQRGQPMAMGEEQRIEGGGGSSALEILSSVAAKRTGSSEKIS